MNEHRKQSSEGEYAGEICLPTSLECPGYSKIIDTTIEPANYSWYYISDGMYNYRELKLQNICEEKVGFMSTRFELTDFGSHFISDLVSLCQKEGIKIECYLCASGSYSNGIYEKRVNYDKIKFGESLKKPKLILHWHLQVTYIVK